MNQSEMKSFLKDLNADEASRILSILLGDNQELIKKAYEIAMETVCDVDADEISGDVYYELDGLDVDELYSHSGRTRGGYVEPYDKAYEMFEDALAPFIDEMKKSQKRGLPEAAKTHCIGIIKGLLMFDEESNSDFKDWITDAPRDYVSTVIKEWKKGNPSNEDIADVTDIMKGGLS